MTFLTLLKRDLVFYWRTNLGTLLLASVCCAVLTGALLVGDSVQSSLLRLSRMRLGKTAFACTAGDRFFRQDLADALQAQSSVPVISVLALQGILESADGSVRVNQVNIYGVDAAFWQLAPQTTSLPEGWPDAGLILVSGSVQSRITDSQAALLLRIETASPLSRDLIFAADQSAAQAWPVTVAGVVADETMGRFSLQTQQDVPLNVFVPIDWLAEKIGRPQQANLLLVPPTPSVKTTEEYCQRMLRQAITLSDYGFQIETIASRSALELNTERIFIDDSVAEAAMKAGQGAYGVFTYFVNAIRAGEKSVPYSMVTAMSENGPVPALEQNEIAVNEWLADELDAEIGGSLELTYYQLTPTGELKETTSTFTVRRVVPMMGAFADPTLMPPFPGLAEADNCRDWEPGMPVDLDKIKPRDERYWDRYRGTPKAFISLETARDIWANRFGRLTAVRYPAAQNSESDIRRALLEQIHPADVGLTFRDVQAQARQSAVGSTDFSGLFGGLSMFLIFSAAILLALVFVFYAESRGSQIGLLSAIGWNWLKIFALFLAEGAVLALSGCLVGVGISVLYARGLIYALNTTFWTQALANLQLVFDANLSSIAVGVCVSFLICLLAVQIALFRRTRRPAHQLLTGTFEDYPRIKRRTSQLSLWLGLMCLAGAILLPLQSALKESQTASFFMTGILLLLAVFFLSAAGLKWLRVQSASFAQSPAMLALRNIPRRTGRSLAVVITLACGVFVVIGVGANYKDIGADVRRRDSGTGGFALIAQTTIPMTEAPTLTPSGQEGTPSILAEAVVPMRLYQKDDASCLNLNRAQQPTLLGVNVEQLAEKGAFTFQKTLDGEHTKTGWQLLNEDFGEGVIPAIGDYPTVVWGLRKGLGDTIAYTDDKGRRVRLMLVGILQGSILQGRLILSEDRFAEHFGSVDGYRFFLIEAEWDKLYEQSAQLARHYRDFGMEIIPAADKLAQFHEVENTYLAIFLVLGGLGLILGSAGLGLVLVLNVLDRRGELAMMQAVGFQNPALSRILFLEHGLLLIGGVLGGFIPALLAVVPVIRTQASDFPYAIVFWMAAAMLISGAVWVCGAIGSVLKMNFLETLRNQ